MSPKDLSHRDPKSRIDLAIGAALARAERKPAPPKLASALRYAVLPGGARVRPLLCLSVAMACGDDRPALADAGAAALEFIHCASLVHDDLPCFDDAGTRRGKPSVHAAYSEPLAVLAGDSLIILAFETLALTAREDAARAAGLSLALAEATGSPHGICAGQGWESEAEVDLAAYHRAKTGALFIAATQMGAVAAGQDPAEWFELGHRIGEAYQVADDLRDAVLDEAELGKPAGQDAIHDRPNAVREYGVKGAVEKLHDGLAAAIASIPACPGEAALCALVRQQADRLTPVAFAHHAP
ncbi:MAG: polyprenyl synthetase family protein [Pseudomonadota bacterium]